MNMGNFKSRKPFETLYNPVMMNGENKSKRPEGTKDHDERVTALATDENMTEVKRNQNIKSCLQSKFEIIRTDNNGATINKNTTPAKTYCSTDVNKPINAAIKVMKIHLIIVIFRKLMPE